jgi:hypothetical protein
VPSVTGAHVSDYTVVATDGTLTVSQAGSATTLGVSSTSITPLQTVTLTATVASSTTGTPTGTVSFYDGSTLLGAASLNLGQASFTTSLAAGTTNVITAAYGGDIDFAASSAITSQTVTVAPLAFALSPTTPGPATVAPGGDATYQLNVAPTYGSYAGTVTFAVSGLPAGATATFSPSSIPANGGQQTVTVTVSVPAATAANRPHSIGTKLATTALALLLLPFAGRLRRHGRHLRQFVCLFLMALGGFAASAALFGCGGNSGFFDQSPKTYTLTITATAGGMSEATTVTLNVE